LRDSCVQEREKVDLYPKISDLVLYSSDKKLLHIELNISMKLGEIIAAVVADGHSAIDCSFSVLPSSSDLCIRSSGLYITVVPESTGDEESETSASLSLGEVVGDGLEGEVVGDGLEGEVVGDGLEGGEGLEGEVVGDGLEGEVVSDGLEGEVVGDGLEGEVVGDGLE
ncbi:Collagen-like protein V6-like, partial [Homarus americanus]